MTKSDHCSYVRNLSSCEEKARKIAGLNGIWTHDLCDAGVVLYKMSYKANWEQGPVVQRADNLIQWIVRYPADKMCAGFSR